MRIGRHLTILSLGLLLAGCQPGAPAAVAPIPAATAAPTGPMTVPASPAPVPGAATLGGQASLGDKPFTHATVTLYWPGENRETLTLTATDDTGRFTIDRPAGTGICLIVVRTGTTRLLSSPWLPGTDEALPPIDLASTVVTTALLSKWLELDLSKPASGAPFTADGNAEFRSLRAAVLKAVGQSVDQRLAAAWQGALTAADAATVRQLTRIALDNAELGGPFRDALTRINAAIVGNMRAGGAVFAPSYWLPGFDLPSVSPAGPATWTIRFQNDVTTFTATDSAVGAGKPIAGLIGDVNHFLGPIPVTMATGGGGGGGGGSGVPGLTVLPNLVGSGR